MYQAARQGLNGWVPVFLPWDARPDRDDFKTLLNALKPGKS